MNISKELLSTAMLCIAISSTLGQGTVDFRNYVSFDTPADRLVRDLNGARLVGTNYFAQLYYGAQGASETDLISVSDLPVRFRASTTTLPGAWNVPDSPFRTLNGFPPGDTVSLQVRVWNSFAGSTWEQAAIAGFSDTQYGVSTLFLYPIPPAGSGNCLTCYYMDNLRGFMLVPEPSVIALAVLGAGGLLLLRRRK